MLGIVAAVLFFIAFLINAADIATNDVFSSVNVMLLGLTALALHVAGIGAGRPADADPSPAGARRRERRRALRCGDLVAATARLCVSRVSAVHHRSSARRERTTPPGDRRRGEASWRACPTADPTPSLDAHV
ncbi:hypothetical protein LUX34_03330 [Streptomyces werraensis]|nr:hypothetical protein [Streptomyces werraensis]